MTLRELKERVDYFMNVQDGIWGDTEVSIPNNKKGMYGRTPTTGVKHASVGIDWDSKTFFIWPETEMEEKSTVGNDGFEFDNSSTIPPDTDADAFINYLRRETGRSKQSIQSTLFEVKEDISNLCRDWYRTHGKKTSDSGLCDAKSIYSERELTVDERMHLWFVDKRPNRDVCDSVDELSDEEKHKYFDECNITRTIQIDIPTIINK